MTVAEEFQDKPFAMLNWHKNWCENQKTRPFCYLKDYIAGDVKRTWENCPHREICFIAFINSEASKEKGCPNNDK